MGNAITLCTLGREKAQTNRENSVFVFLSCLKIQILFSRESSNRDSRSLNDSLIDTSCCLYLDKQLQLRVSVQDIYISSYTHTHIKHINIKVSMGCFSVLFESTVYKKQIFKQQYFYSFFFFLKKQHGGRAVFGWGRGFLVVDFFFLRKSKPSLLVWNNSDPHDSF